MRAVLENHGNNRMAGLWTKAEKTIHHHSRQFVRHLRGAWWTLQHFAADRPVFVIGCSRAGTTLVYRTLSEADELGSRNRESHDFWAELHPLAERDWESHVLTRENADTSDRAVVSRYFFAETGRRRFVDKNNQNGLAVPYLLALFPDARFVYVKRSPGDNIHSLIEGWGQPQRFGVWAEHLPARVSVDGGRYTRWCFFLPRGWRNYVSASIEQVCAYQYLSMNEAIMGARQSIPSNQWTEIKYEDILSDPAGTFRSTFQDLGLNFGGHQISHCESILDRPYNAFSKIELDKWRHGGNQQRIEAVLPLIAETAHQMGY